MKCKSCDDILSDREARRKYILINEYIDLCDCCFNPVREELGFGPPEYFLDTTSELVEDSP